MPEFEIKFAKHFEKEKREHVKNILRIGLPEYVEKIDNQSTKLGEGKAAEVFTIEEEHLCIKVIKDKQASPNDIYQEMDIHDEAYTSGAKTPEPTCVCRLDGMEFFVMEKIDGSTLREFLQGTNKTELPEDFDWQSVVDAVEQYLQAMHEKGVHHRDLHMRNIMIDVDGRVYIIDFGDSKMQYLRSEDAYRDETIRGTTVYTKDEDNLRTIKQKIHKFINQQ